jgi:hypothetical protein
VFLPDELESLLGEDYQFPKTQDGRPSFLNRVNEQLGNAVNTFHPIEAGASNDARLLLEDGTIPTPTATVSPHLQIESDPHASKVLALMNQAFNTHQPPSYTHRLSAPAQIGYRENNQFSITNETSGNTPRSTLQITDGSTIGSVHL